MPLETNETKPSYELTNIEVFSEGTWNGDEYTSKDLDEMVKAFNETKSQLKPFLKLGHDESQRLLQQDGLPAAGWITNLYRVGKKLVCDVTDIPEKVYQLIKNKGYRTVSSEIFWNLKIGDKKYNKVLGAVALLGANLPAVTNLNDLLALYMIDSADALKHYTMGDEMDEKLVAIEAEKQELQAKIEQLEADKVELSANVEATALKAKEVEEKLVAVEAEKKEMSAKVEAIEIEKRENEIESFIANLESENLITAACKSYLKALVKEDKKVYSIEEKEMKKEDVLKQIFSLIKEGFQVNFTESSKEVSSNEDKVEAYAKEHGCSYKEAYLAINKGA